MKGIKLNWKLLLHIIAITQFLFGIVVIHTIFNNFSKFYYFFWIELNFTSVLDFSLIELGLSFFIEFYLSFNQINIQN